MTLLGQLQELTLGVPLASGFSSNFIRLVFRLEVLEMVPFAWFLYRKLYFAKRLLKRLHVRTF